jgi:tRNA dimethylallyltransferase
MNRQKHLIVIGGATATGKTAVGIQVAKHFNTEILSADSRQFYREMSIGTAKPTAEELSQVPHHFINSLSIHEDYSVGDFEADALDLLKKRFENHDVLVLVGGSGLFIRALC